MSVLLFEFERNLNMKLVLFVSLNGKLIPPFCQAAPFEEDPIERAVIQVEPLSTEYSASHVSPVSSPATL